LSAVTEPARERLRVLAPLALAAGLAWIVLALGSGSVAIPAMCSAVLLWSVPSPDAYVSVFAFVSPLKLAVGWAVMVVAMMLITVHDPLIHLRQRSFRRVRPWCTLLFVGGYVAVWTLAGVIFVGVALTVQMALPSAQGPLILSSVVALIWQMSPWKQLALNKCHRRPILAAFAPAAYRNALSLGLQHGLWCISSCWALMLAALLAPAHHVAIMAIVALYIWAERLDSPRDTRWQMRVPLKAMRLIAFLIAKADRDIPNEHFDKEGFDRLGRPSERDGVIRTAPHDPTRVRA
jgi:predicted metal-binding membrane protein